MRNYVKHAINRLYPEVRHGFGIVYDELADIKHELNVQKESIVTPVSQLTKALHGVEPYQPLYGLHDFISNPMRSNSHERCEAMYKALRRDVVHLSMLDIGSSLGYVPLYFADRGASAEGWDTDIKNIQVSQLAQNLNGVQGASFAVRHFDEETLDVIQRGEFDVASLLSVMHHIAHQRGFGGAQDLLKSLIDKVPVLFVELALKDEFTNSKKVTAHSDETADRAQKLAKVLPKDPREFFAKIDDVEIVHLGDFDTHLTNVKRPLYMVSRKILQVGPKAYPYTLKKKVAYKNSGANANRVYYTSRDHFIKEYRFKSDDKENLIQIVGELHGLLTLRRENKKDSIIPALIDYSIEGDKVLLVLEAVAGDVLFSFDYVIPDKDLRSIMVDIAQGLVELEELGLHHNDLRPWNVMRDISGKTRLIDLGNAYHQPREDNMATFVWTGAYLASGIWEAGFDAQKMPSAAIVKESAFLTDIRKQIVDKKVKNFKELHAYLLKQPEGK